MSMQKQLAGRSLLTLTDLTDGEFLYLLDLADELKRKKHAGERGACLDRKHIALIFEKMSTRTRCACAVAASDEGGATEYLTSLDIHLGKKESVKDTARVLGRMFNGIMFRGFKQETVDALSQHSGVPVWNGLTDIHHPTQGLADLMTIRESFGRLRGLKVVYVGDGRNNVATTLMLACAKVGIHFVNCTPEALMPEGKMVSWCKERAQLNGGSVSIDTDPVTAVVGANVIYTDVWVSMGEEDKQAERIALLSPYQITMEMMKRTGNLDKKEVIFLHCLPAFHDTETEVTKESGALEVTDEVFEAPFSRVFDEAENRMHTIKALFVSAIGQQK
ncbi:MAG: ornithine carbamoyltransferase [Verrucomicrobia bacterium]|jgi:ornithine carbamoyltransferase|nr:ornithine carbamoyltransferase [Verrucomicrobiota bacterium]